MSDIKAFLLDDDRGVSPVIGVILMVAITVILAAVIAAFVLGLGDTNDPAPQVSFDYDYDNDTDTLTATMTGGETFNPGNVKVTGDLGSSSGVDANESDPGITVNSTSGYEDGNQISAGDSFNVSLTGSEAEIRIVFESGGNSNEIGTFEGPDA